MVQRVALALHFVGSIAAYFSIVYVVPLLVALCNHEEWRVFLWSGLITLGAGLCLRFAFKPVRELERTDAFLVVSLAWLVLPLLGASCYAFSGLPFIDAFFETMSGLSTTGATVLAHVETLPRGLLLWRSLTQWLGGMGVIVLFIAVLPGLRVGGSQLFAREFPGPMPERLRPRIGATARLLWTVYVGFTAAEAGLLYFVAGLPLFDSVCVSLCTLSTGGFTPTTGSIGAYANPVAEYIVIAFMFLAGMSFLIHYQVVRRNLKILVTDEEFRLYVIILLGGTALLVLSEGFGLCRDGLFQAVSIMTTTGFATSDFGSWHFGARIVLLLLMLVGGCGGSTAGGMKVVRALVLLKHSGVMMKKAVSPSAVIAVKCRHKVVPDEVIRDIISFFFLYLVLEILVAVGLGYLGLDFETSLSAVAATLGNVGPGLGAVGPSFSYAWVPPIGKLLLILCMWLGRLELFTVLMIFTPYFWRR